MENREEIKPEDFTEYTLEELREQQERLRRMFQVSQVPREKEIEYIKKLNDYSGEGFNLSNAVKTVQAQTRARKKIKPVCSYGDAKKVAWSAYKSIVGKKEPEMTEDLKEVLRMLTAYFSGNECGEVDQGKGIYLYGQVGTGKTSVMEAMQLMARALRYDVRRFRMTRVQEVYEMALRQEELGWMAGENRCFDDIGFSQSKVKIWGNSVNPLEGILTRRYNRRMEWTTHATSNVPPGALSELFDERLLSRFNEMFNIVPLFGWDFRKL